MSTRRSLDGWPAALGPLAVLVTWCGIAVSIVLAPWFSPFGNALSDLGARGRPTAPVFNLALVVGGVLGTGFVAWLWATVEEPMCRAASPLLVLALFALSLVGRFPIPSPLHAVVAVLFFGLVAIGVFMWGLGDYAAGRLDRAAVLLVLSAVHVVSWLWWILFPWTPSGIAIPELVGSATLVTWAVWVGLDHLGSTSKGAPGL